ncbi:hypothetical protein BBK82_41005 [Lentzea guizhouensis]|uniref:DUF4383 domain-containing protein n=1 Tax=Lentzea guizhouensis TaxID=1586287 RepID=A0A1B2HUM5_9PSEU|nr:DUF4383 domain-containing protein [Lentzea guizhouensis]ANZ41398.1 hypothetical protein BBK82_41005 [Lentzea guizhouensis]
MKPVQTAAAVVGGAFALVGVLGFIPGITTHYDQLSFAGHHSGALLFGLFAVSVLHNLVHLAFGVGGLAMSRTAGTARLFLVVGGGIYVLLWVYGSVIGAVFGEQTRANLLPVNAADNWLHLGLGAAMLLLGIGTTAYERSRGDYTSAGHTPNS